MANKTDWEKIRNEWETTDITLKALAEKYNVKEGTIKSRRSREKWSKDATDKKDATLNGDATKKNGKDATKNKPSNKSGKNKASSNGKKKSSSKRSGNPNPKNQFSERNNAALKHGLFSRYIPKETLELMGSLNKDDPADIIWDQITLQYASIIRAQQIMHVESKEELIKEVKKEKDTLDGTEEEFEIQFAWDRQAAFMNAQSKAIGELRTSIKQFLEMAHDEDERLLKLEQMETGIDKTKAEIEKISGVDDERPIQIEITRAGDDDV